MSLLETNFRAFLRLNDMKNNIVTRYFSEVKTEMSKVTWPTRKETMQYTILVIVISLVVAGYLGGLDYLFTQGLALLIS